MPYKLSPDKKTVMVYKDGKWRVLKRYASAKKALMYFKALQANVKH